MAVSIGELIAHIGADTSDLRKGMKEAEARIVALEAQLKALGSKAGAAGAGLGGVTAGAKNMTPAINAARGAMAAMATQAAGIPGPLGMVVAQFGSLALGGPVVVGVLAAMAGVALAIKHVGDEAAKQAAPLKKFMEMDFMGRGKALEMERGAAMSGARAGELREMLRTGQREVLDLSGPGGLARGTKMVDLTDKEAREFREELHKASTQARDFAESKLAPAATVAAEALEKVGKSLEDMNRTAALMSAGAENALLPWRAKNAMAGGSGAASARQVTGVTDMTPFGDTLSMSGPGLAANQRLAKSGGLGPEAAQGALGKAASAAGDALKSFGPAALGVTALFEIFKGVMEPLQPILDVVSGLLQSIGNVIGTLLAPVLKIVAKVFSYVVQAVGIFVEALGKFVDSIIPDWISKAGKNLTKAGQQMQDDAKAGRAAMDKEAEYDHLASAAKGAAEALSNVPSGYKVALARFNATTGVPGGMASASYQSAPAVTQQFSPGAVVIDAAGMDPDELYRVFARKLEAEASRGGASAFALAGSL